MIRSIKLTEAQYRVADYRFLECAWDETAVTTVKLTRTTLSWDAADDRFVRSILDNAEDIVADWATSGCMSPAERGERQATNALVAKARQAMAEVVPFQSALSADMWSTRRPDVVTRLNKLSDVDRARVMREAEAQYVSEHECYPNDPHHALDFVENGLDLLAEGWFAQFDGMFPPKDVPAVEVDHNPVPTMTVDEAVLQLSRVTDLPVDGIEAGFARGYSLTVDGRMFRPENGAVSVYVDLTKPADVFDHRGWQDRIRGINPDFLM